MTLGYFVNNHKSTLPEPNGASISVFARVATTSRDACPTEGGRLNSSLPDKVVFTESRHTGTLTSLQQHHLRKFYPPGRFKPQEIYPG
jgi:hypothetical protein